MMTWDWELWLNASDLKWTYWVNDELWNFLIEFDNRLWNIKWIVEPLAWSYYRLECSLVLLHNSVAVLARKTMSQQPTWRTSRTHRKSSCCRSPLSGSLSLATRKKILKSFNVLLFVLFATIVRWRQSKRSEFLRGVEREASLYFERSESIASSEPVLLSRANFFSSAKFLSVVQEPYSRDTFTNIWFFSG